MTDGDTMWVRLLGDFDHCAANQTTAYLKGMRVNIVRAGGELAVKLQRAVEIAAPNRPTAERLAKDPFAADLPDPAPPAGAAAPNAAPPAAQATPAPAAASGPPAGSPAQAG